MREFAAYWRMDQIQLESGDYRGRIRGVHTGVIQLGLSEQSISTRVDGSVPAGSVVVALRLPSPHATSFRGRRLESREMAIIRAGEEIASLHAGASRILTVAIAEPLADEIARCHGCASFDAVFPGDRLAMATPPAIATAGRRLLGLLDEVFKNAQPFATLAAAEDFERRIIKTLFSEAHHPPSGQLDSDGRKHARSAENHLRDHMRQPLDLLRLCRELGTTPRTLQSGFHNTFGLSMKSYSQALRFNGTRRDLIAADPAVDSVKAVALDWGFRHMGRFATDYRKWFGECPGMTLAK